MLPAKDVVFSLNHLEELQATDEGSQPPCRLPVAPDLALDIFIALHSCAVGSRFVLPSRYDSHGCMSHATLNRITQLSRRGPRSRDCRCSRSRCMACARLALRYSTKWPSMDWIERCLAHEDGRSLSSVYNKAEYAEQRRHMLQE